MNIKYVNESQRIEQVSKHLTWEDQVNGWRTEDFWLTDNQQKLNEDLLSALENIGLNLKNSDFSLDYSIDYAGVAGLEKFLNDNKNNKDLKVVLNLKREGFDESTVLHNVANFNIEAVDLFLKAGANPNLQDRQGKTPLHYAANFNCCESVKSLLIAGADPNLQDKEGKTPLHCTSYDDNYDDTLDALLRKGARVDIQDNQGNTPLHHAAERGYINGVGMLIEKSKNINLTNKNKETALHRALDYSKDPRVAEPILDKDNVNMNIQDRLGLTPLSLAALQSHADVLKLILKKGADTKHTDKEGNTALHYAVGNAYCGSNLSTTKYDFHTPDYDSFSDSGSEDTALENVNVLIAEKIGINTPNKNGNTPLFFAIEAKNLEVIERLLEEGSDTTVADKNGYTAFHYAIKSKNLETLKLLLFPKLNVPKLNAIKDEIKDILSRNSFPAIEEDIVKKVLPCIKKDSGLDVIESKIEKILPKEDKEACSAIKREISQILIENAKKSADLASVIDEEGNTLLHHAVKWGCGVEMLDFLVEGGIDINAKNKNGVAPIHIAVKYGNISFIDFFIRNKANINVQCGKFKKSEIEVIDKNVITVQDGNMDASSIINVRNDIKYKEASPMYIAADSGNSTTTTTLLSDGAKSNVADKRGWTPLQIAIKRACDKKCTEKERKERYEMIERLASVSSDLMFGIPKSPDDQILGKIKRFIKTALGIADNKKVQNKVEHDLLLQVMRDDKEIMKILENAVKNRSGDKKPTAPISEETSAPIFDYDEVGSHVKEIPDLLLPIQYPDLSNEVREMKWDDMESQVSRPAATQENSMEVDKGLWSNQSTDALKKSLTPDQQVKLNKFLGMVSKAQDVVQLEKIVNEAIESGVRLNFSQDKKYNFTDCVIQKIYALNGIKKSPKTASDIMYKLVSRGAIFDQNYNKINDELEKVFKEHKANIEKAYLEHDSRINEFQRTIESAISKGELEGLEIDNATFYLEYSQDSVVDVAKVIDAARSLGIYQGNMTFGGNIVKVGDSEVEIEINNDTRNYTDLSDNGDIVLTFYTSLGELDVRLTENKDKIEVEVSDRKKFDQLVSNNEEIGKNCLLGGYSVCDAINKGCFERSGKLQPSEALGLPKKVIEEASEIIKNLQYSDIKENSWTDTVQHSRGNREGVQI